MAFDKSHPSWVCGLKHAEPIEIEPFAESHPSWVCGLKLIYSIIYSNVLASHPSWVCGLKPHSGRSTDRQNGVTPFVGVWIET